MDRPVPPYNRPHPDDYEARLLLAEIEAWHKFRYCVSTEVVLAEYHAAMAMAS